MRPRSPLGDPRRRCALLVVSALLAACAGCAQLAPTGLAPAGALAHPPPPAAIVAMASSMSPEGKAAFYAARPEVVDRAEMASLCTKDEAFAVLGCYRGGRIYILQVTRPELAGIMEVTAAHEMLHAVYDHLPPGERLRVERSVDDLYQRTNGPRLQESLAAYEGLDPEDRLNELHSILGTETIALNPALAGHFGRFFASRQHVVEANERVRNVFKAIEQQVDGLIAEADLLKGTLAALEARLTADDATLQSLDRRLEALRAAGDAAAHNRLLPERNGLAHALRQGIDQYNKLVDEHNAKVTQIEALALEQNKLVSALQGRAPSGP